MLDKEKHSIYLKTPFVSTVIFGLLAHAFMLTNKIPVDDDICNMFSKGATLVSGRWGLELLRPVFPDISMPWLYGLMSILFIAGAVCLITAVFDIRRTAVQVLLAAVIVSFPAETGTMSYMFTSAPYALSLLLSVASVYALSQRIRLWWLLSPLLLILSCGIYQAYFGFAASLCVILMVYKLLNGEDASAVFRSGLVMLAVLIVSAGIYALSVLISGRVVGTLTSDVLNTEQGFLLRIAVAYSSFLHTLLDGYFAYVNSAASRAAHIILILCCGFCLGRELMLRRDLKCTFLTLLCLFLLPLSCYCLYLLADNGYIHSLALYPFASVYVLAAILLDRALPENRRIFRQLGCAALILIVMCNTVFANSFYLRCYLQYENTYSFYMSVLSRVTAVEGFDADCRLAIIGERGDIFHDTDSDFDFDSFQLPGNNITETIHAENIIHNYLGFDIPFADEDERARISEAAEFSAMGVYPAPGSVTRIGDCIVVKLQ